MPRVKKRHSTKNFESAAAKRKSQSPLPEETGVVSGLPGDNELGEGDYASCYDDDSSDEDSVDDDGAYVDAQATLPMHWAQLASQRLELAANNHGCPPFLDEEADSTEDEDCDADNAQLLVRQIIGDSSEDEAGDAQAAMGGEENAVTPLSVGGSGTRLRALETRLETHRLKGECPPERRNFKAQWPILVFIGCISGKGGAQRGRERRRRPSSARARRKACATAKST